MKHMFFRGSLTEVSDLLGFSLCFKDGGTQKHTQTVTGHSLSAPRRRKGPLDFHSGFTIKSQI